MNTLKWLNAFIVAELIVSLSWGYPFASADDYYVVRSGEILTRIARQTFGGPTYSESGAYVKILSLNPELENPHLIFPGQKIRISRSLACTTPPKKEELKDVVTPVPVSSPAREVASDVATQEVPASLSAQDDSVQSSLRIGLGGTYYRIQGTDTVNGGKVAILSNLSPGFHLGWNIHWDDTTTFTLSGDVQRYSLQQFNDTQSFNESTGTRSGLGLNYAKKLSSRFGYGVAFKMEEGIFFHAKSATVLAIDKVMIMQPALSGRYSVLQKKNAEAGVLGEFGVLLPASTGTYQVKTGYHGLAGVFVRHHSTTESHRGIEGQVFYVYDQQDTSISTRSNQELGLKLFYVWALPW